MSSVREYLGHSLIFYDVAQKLNYIISMAVIDRTNNIQN